jgi:hypothetical protein
MAQLHIQFGSACRIDALEKRDVPSQPNGGAMCQWRDALFNWLIVGFRYAAQAAAMREGHLWDIAPRVVSGGHGGELPLPASMSPLTKRASVPERAT